MADVINAELRAHIDTVQKACKADTSLYKACLALARVDKTKVEDSTDKLVVMRALRILHSMQEVNADKSLPKARI